jgi:hypothetical protein
MRCYQVRVLNNPHAPTYELVCADDERAIRRASELAAGSGFEIWRGGRCLYVGG